jgi:hypothetical protein
MDAVVLWVDSSDPKYIERKKIALGQQIVKDITNYRIGDRSTLKYCLRGLYFNTPWLNTIYIITDDQWPKWLNEEKCKNLKPRIIRVDHKTISPIKKSMYSSTAIEACLHRIPNLSNYFLYANDDMFIVQPVKQSFFMNSKGVGIFRTGYPITPNLINNNEFHIKWLHIYQTRLASNMYNLYNYKFWLWTHQINVLCKHSFHIVEKHYPKLIKDTQTMLGRQEIPQIGLLLMNYVSQINNLHESVNNSNAILFDDKTNYKTAIINKDTIFLCTNNIHNPSSNNGYIAFMNKLFPNKIPSEITVL